MKITDTGLPPRVARALAEQGIPDTETLGQYSLDDIEALEGIGAKSLLQIAKLKDTLTVTQQIDEEAGGDNSANEAKQKWIDREPPKDQRTTTTEDFTVSLQFRHAKWVRDTADMLNTTPEHIIEQAVRRECQRDPYKAGAAVGSSTVLKHDNPLANAGGSGGD